MSGYLPRTEVPALFFLTCGLSWICPGTSKCVIQFVNVLQLGYTEAQGFLQVRSSIILVQADSDPLLYFCPLPSLVFL